MFNLENIKNLEKKLNSKFYYNYDIYKNTWFRTGGKTKVFCIIYDDKELEIILNNIGIIKYHIIGAGSNILIRDKGFDGIIFKFGKKFNNLSLRNDSLNVGAGILDINLSKFALLNSIKNLEKLSNKIKNKISIGDTILLYGEIGVGKTTFARLLINNLEKYNKIKKSEVLSPTFNIVFQYDIKDFTIEHYDLYRLKNENEIKNIGLFENLEESIIIVEWPELIKDKPINRIDLFFEYTKDMNERILTIKTSGRLKVNEF